MGIWSNRDRNEFGGGVSWWFESKSDSRFKGSGSCSSLWSVDDEVNQAIERLEKQLGVKAPDDIEMGGIKD